MTEGGGSKKVGIAIFGAACAVGAELCELLGPEADVEAILGFDGAAQWPAKVPAKLTYQPTPGSDAAAVEALKQANARYAIYLAPVVSAATDDARRLDDAAALRRFFAACDGAAIEGIVLTSGGAVYGARSENPSYFAEGAPLRPAGLLPGEADLARERLCVEYARKHGATALAVCRLPQVVGAGTRGVVSRMVASSKIMVVDGFDPPVQFLHADDVAGAVARLLKTRKSGVYNVAPDDYTTYLQLGRAFKKPLSRASPRMAKLKSWIGSFLGGLSPAYLPLLQYPILLANKKLKRDTGYQFKYGSETALAQHAKHDKELVGG